MRIGLVTDHFPPRAVGGGEWSIAALAELLHPRLERLVVGVMADTVASREEQDAPCVVRFRAPLEPVDGRGRPRPWALANPCFTLMSAWRLFGLARRERLQLLHCQSHAALPATYLAARALRVPVVAMLRDTRTLCEPAVCLHRQARVPADCGHAKLLRQCADEFLDLCGAPGERWLRWRRKAGFSYLWADNRLRWWCLRRCDGVVALSAAMLDVYRERGLLDAARSRLRVIPCPAPSPPPDAGARREAARRRLGIGAGPVAAYVGKHSAGKGTPVLRQAWDRLAQRHPQATLVLAGPGHPPADAPGLKVAGPLSHSDALDLILAADVVVNPSQGPEALGRSLVEAAGFGRALVGARAGGIPEVVRHGVNGLLVERGDPSALAAALGRLLEDAPLRQRLARGQEEALGGFLDPGRIGDAHLELYGALLGGAGAPP